MDARITADENRATDFAARNGEARHNRATSWFSSMVAELWPIKGPAAVSQYTRCPDRTARAYASGDREPPASVLRDLLRGDEGYRVLTYVMCGFVPTWWLVIQQEHRVVEQLRALSPALRGIIDGIEA